MNIKSFIYYRGILDSFSFNSFFSEREKSKKEKIVKGRLEILK